MQRSIVLAALGVAGLCIAASLIRKPPVVNVNVHLEMLDDGEMDEEDLPPDYFFGDVNLTESDWNVLDDLDFPSRDD